MDNNIHQVVKDLIPEERRNLEALNPDDLLDRIEERLITADQLQYKRLQFEVAKQKESEDLWQFENRLHYLQKQAKIKEDAWFVETYKKGILNNKLRDTRPTDHHQGRAKARGGTCSGWDAALCQDIQ